MVLTLAWLTVSLPFVNAAQQKAAAENCANAELPGGCNEEESDNPFANTTEEKTSNSVNSLSEEYLHHTNLPDQYFSVSSTEYKVEHASTYIAFHGELICPPPDLS
jgi:hypothetical protein